jgi:hypothetical protein
VFTFPDIRTQGALAEVSTQLARENIGRACTALLRFGVPAAISWTT